MSGVRLTAPAKINLYLHVTGRRADGYHLLDSLIAFADTGDEIAIAPARDFSLSIEGPFAASLDAGADNLVTRAAMKTCARLGVASAIAITLTKNLPVGSGIGGGSADAAATVRGLMDFFGRQADVSDILIDLGADVSACYHSVPLRITKIGEEIELVTPFPRVPVLLVNPLRFCPTPAVFQSLSGISKQPAVDIPPLSDRDALYRFLATTRNDLTQAAIGIVPEIKTVLEALDETQPRLARMSGSGATCFALFDTDAQCEDAARRVGARHLGWWVTAGSLNSPGS